MGGVRAWRGWTAAVLGAFVLVVGAGEARVSAGDGVPPPPGTIVEVDGRGMHLWCMGSGSPAVVLDAGSGDFSLDWALVLPGVATATRVCAYDRAGFGWSELGTGPRDARTAVAELRSLLSAAGVEPPYVLAGHSSGGIRMQVFALEHPEEVAALVLVDSTIDLTPEEQLAALSAETRAAFEMVLQTPGMGPAAITLTPEALLPLVPMELWEQLAVYVALEGRASQQQAEADESAAFEASVAQLREVKAARGEQPFGDLPLLVLVNGQLGLVASLAGPPAEAGLTRLAVERELAAHLAGQSRRGELIVAEGSGHYIQLDQPELVVQAIVRAVAAARGG